MRTPRVLHALPLLALAVACGSAPKPVPVPPKAPPAPKAAARTPSPDDFRNARPKTGEIAEHEYPAVETATLVNGLSLYVVRRPAGVVSFSIVARGGASQVPEGKSGLAALTARMMTEGTKRHGALALAEAAESLGTTLEESAGRDYVRLAMTTAREDLRAGLTLLSEVVREPAFAKPELERVRSEWLDSIEAERQSPPRLSALVGLRLLLGAHLGAPVSGSRTDVTALTRADLVRFHAESFVPKNAALVVVGDVSLAEVRPLATELLGAWGGAAPKPAPAETPPSSRPGKKVFVVDRPGSVQSAIFIGQPFPKRAEPGYEARELLSSLLGGLFTSRINTNLREEHAYTYGARSLDMATRGWGAFAVMTSVRTDVTGAALHEALSELRKARDPALGRPIADAEVSLARVDLKQHLGASLSHTEEVALRVEDLFVYGLPSDYLRKYPTILDSSATGAVAAEGRRLTPDDAVIVVVGDRAAIAPALSAEALSVEVAPDALSD
jgi:zinc protease